MTTETNSLKGKHVNVAMMTSGGLAPCLSSSVADFMKYWIQARDTKVIQSVSFRLYKAGYKGILIGDSILLPETEWASTIDTLHKLGGSPMGSSRVKLTNIDDCRARGYCSADSTPLEVASLQLLKDNIHVLHTIGGDDTNTQAAQLSKYLLEQHNGKVIVVGMPKTIDNDVYPIVQTLGANTAACQGALFFSNVVNECTANPSMLILHECMGRDSGYLTAQTALEYRNLLLQQQGIPDHSSLPFVSKKARDVHAIWIPELPHFDLQKEAVRLKSILQTYGCVNVFFGEGTGVNEIVADMERNNVPVPRDAFGHVALAKINPGQYFSQKFATLVGAEKVLVQKSGYFSRAAPSNAFDQALIDRFANAGVESALAGVSGCMGQDEDTVDHQVRAIEFERIKGGKPFDVGQSWFVDMLKDIGQTA